MRRAFVIFLILLFPLNVFALSTSVSSVQQAAMTQYGGVSAGDLIADTEVAPEMQSMGDPDADEPPSGMDFHDTVNEEGHWQSTILPGRSLASQLPSRRGLAPFPPVKPPPLR
ncbi:hypothetical protein ACHAC9_09745 [Massilia sp. CMS3.1]|uniref:hypothetical protein n=1 Tax=Massilia sp. CMS3.1 TaxID=3373083 RepID=UPI003EE7F11A